MSIASLRERLQSYFQRLLAFGRAHPSIPFIVVITLAIIYTFFTGEYTVMRFARNYTREMDLKRQYQVYRPRYEADSARLSELKNNKELIERIAREHYYMHLPGEEIFLLRPDTTIPSEAPSQPQSENE